MTDQAFTTWGFAATGTGAVSRTQPDRLHDFINVCDYGLVGDGSYDNSSALTALFTNTSLGATLFFPPGNYICRTQVTVPNDAAGRVLMGSGWGGVGSPSRGTVLYGGGAGGYVLYCAQNSSGDRPISHIEGLTFKNDTAISTASFTTPDPIDQPGGSATGACGGIYLPNSSWVSIVDCNFDIRSGVAVYMPGIANSIHNFNITMGNGDSSGGEASIGIWGVGSIDSGKILGCRYGIVAIQNIELVQSMDIERCKTGIYYGNPYPFWDRNTNVIKSINHSDASCVYHRANCIQFESIGSGSAGGAFMDMKQCTSGIFTNIRMNSLNQIGTPEYGLKLAGSGSNTYINLEASGAFSIAAIAYAGGEINNVFQNVSGVVSSGGGVPWLLRTSNNGEHYCPDLYINCPVDGGLPLSLLPVTGHPFGATGICTDSTVPAWNGTVSNVGKPVVGSGTYRVLIRWGTVTPTLAAAASWIVGATTITMALSGPGTVVAGMAVIDVQADCYNYLGKVSSYSGTTLTLAGGGAIFASKGSADSLVFGTWCIAG